MSLNPGSERWCYGLRELARLSGAPEAQLRRWDRSGLLPAAREAGQLRYRFADVIAARTARALIGQGLTARRVREAVEVVRAWRPDVPHPLASLRIMAEGGQLLVRLGEQLVEGRSGQILLDLPLSEEPPGAVTRAFDGGAALDADGWIDRALAAERSGAPSALIRDRYARALDLDPDHPGALIGAANLDYAHGALETAKELYARATAAAPQHPHPWYNLANVLDDLGQLDAAAAAYAEALERDEAFVDAHFNLALLWEKHGQRRRALAHWLRVIALDPGAESAALARRFVEDETDR